MIAAAVYEVAEPTYAAFSTAFDNVRNEHFGEISETQLYVVIALCLLGFTAHLSATIGLLRFKRWSRWMFWGSALLGIPGGMLPTLYPYWSSYWTSWAVFIGSGLFGMILLLAYARGHGANWFANERNELRDKNDG
jgi:hypothetical protein